MNGSHIILIIGVILLILVINHNIQTKGMVYVKSNIDGNNYLVRDQIDKQSAANFLAKLNKNIHGITEYMNNKLNNPSTASLPRYQEYKPYILQLKDKIQNVVIKESPSNSSYTSYTVNKGEQIIFCIRSKTLSSMIKNTNNIHDFNIVMYVMLHEISHVACPEYDHTPLFKKIFKFICEEAIEMGIYKKVDFENNPMEYCGMMINETII